MSGKSGFTSDIEFKSVTVNLQISFRLILKCQPPVIDCSKGPRVISVSESVPNTITSDLDHMKDSLVLRNNIFSVTFIM